MTAAAVLLIVGAVASAQAEKDAGHEQSLDYAQVVHVVAARGSGVSWRFDVTVRHNDQGWDHYADAWQVVHPGTGDVIAERVLAHPHDTEQPFTRSLSGVAAPPDTTTVIVRARCNVHGFGGREVIVDLTNDDGDRYEVRNGA